MKSVVCYLELNSNPKLLLIKLILVYLLLVFGTYYLHHKYYIISNLLLAFALISIETNRFDEMLLYSVVISLLFNGFFYFRIFSFKIWEPWMFTCKGMILSVISSSIGYLFASILIKN